jgi:hypothetical protein
MKRVLVVLLFFGTVGAVFAQDFKFKGYVNSGLGIIMSTEEDSKPQLVAFGNDSEQWNYRLRLDGSYVNKDNNTGVNVRIEGQNTSVLSIYF